MQYPAPGSHEFALETKRTITKTEVGLDDKWGLYHGCWSVVKNLYPNADIPVFQLSLDYNQAPAYHFELAKELASIRKKGVLIIGSGNMVHNLGLADFQQINDIGYGYDWALEARDKMKNFILSGDMQSLINYKDQGKAFSLAIPTPQHYLPLLYALALKENDESISLFNDKVLAGSLTMTSLKISKG